MDEAELDYTFLIFREDFMRTFIADKFFVYRLLYYYQTDTPPYLFAAPEELAEYMRLLGKIKQELLHPVADTYNLIVSVLYYLLVVINRAYAKTYRLPVEVPKNNYAFQFKDLLEKHIRDMQRVQEYADILRVSRITLNNSVMAQFGVVRHPSAQTTLVGGIEKRAVVLRPQREPVGGRVPLFRPQPSDALLQATDGKDIYAIYHGLPKWNIRMKSKKKLYKTCTPILFFCIFAVGESF